MLQGHRVDHNMSARMKKTGASKPNIYFHFQKQSFQIQEALWWRQATPFDPVEGSTDRLAIWINSTSYNTASGLLYLR